MHRLTALWGPLLLLLCAAAAAQPPAPAALELRLPAEMPPEVLANQWDARARNMVYLVKHDWGGVVLGLHIFEDLLGPAESDKRFVNNRRIDAERFEWTREGTDLKFHILQQEVIPFEMSGRLYERAGRVFMEADVTNRGRQDWPSTGALMCLRAGFAPEFADPEGARIDVWRRGATQPVSVREACGTKSKYFRCLIDGPQEAFEPWIVKRNQAGTRWLEFTSEPCAQLGGNRDPWIGCVHADIQLQLAAGQSRKISAEVAFDQPTRRGAPPGAKTEAKRAGLLERAMHAPGWVMLTAGLGVAVLAAALTRGARRRGARGEADEPQAESAEKKEDREHKP